VNNTPYQTAPGDNPPLINEAALERDRALPYRPVDEILDIWLDERLHMRAPTSGLTNPAPTR